MEKNKTLEVNIKPFIKRGYEKITVSLVLRDTSEGLLYFEEGGIINLPNEYDSFFPFGNPPPFFAGMGIKNKKVYVSIFVAKNISFNLMMETILDKDFVNPLLFLKSLKKEAEKILEIINSENPDQINIDFKIRDVRGKVTLPKLEGLDSVFYSVMSRSPVMVIGEEEKLIEFLGKIIYALPDKIQKRTSFKINLEYEGNENISLFAANPKYLESFSLLLNNEEQIIDIVDLRHNKIYSNYEVKALQTILEKTNFDAESVKAFLTDVYKMSLKVSEECDPNKIGDYYNIDYDLADLVKDTSNALKQI